MYSGPPLEIILGSVSQQLLLLPFSLPYIFIIKMVPKICDAVDHFVVVRAVGE